MHRIRNKGDIIGEIGKACPRCGRFFTGNKCPYCGYEIIPVIPKPLMKEKKNGAKRIHY